MNTPIRTRPPLGLPEGSVRALLSLMIVSVVVLETARGQRELALSMMECLMMVLALYFSNRRFVRLPKSTMEQLEKDASIPSDRHPLFLPRYSIRILILASFIGLAVYLHREERLFTDKTLLNLGLVASYLLGALLRPIGVLLRHWEFPAALLERFADARALVILVAVGIVSAGYWFDFGAQLPKWFEPAALHLLLFYFGAR
ncbi:MAG: hypothetical protein FJ297_00830 [Planctomycetes bacterium]|nr:hypothetical protein [Planctomycetota bacterium]